jgi:Ca-activated chloride channel family protein
MVLSARRSMMSLSVLPIENRERYAGKAVAPVHAVANDPVSTFSIDVDTGSYANVRRMLNQGRRPAPEAVRTEEMLNYFRYAYPQPVSRNAPFSVTTDVSRTPWNKQTRLLRVGLRGYDVAADKRPPANLVFLVDVSGSMNEPDKLPLVKLALNLLADRLTPRDRVSIVVYAGAAGLVLEPTANPAFVHQALDCLSAGGSTAGGAGIALAYATARASRIPGGINRVILATDGDFNVGMTKDETLQQLVRRNRDDGITLTTLGFGQGNYNDAMMEKIADVGNGNYAYIDTALEARKVLDDELSATLVTIAKDVKVQVEFNSAFVSEYRLIGYENRALAEEDFKNDAVDAGDMGAGHQVTALYEIVPAGSNGWLPPRHFAANRTPPAPSHSTDVAWVKLRYKRPNSAVSTLVEHPVKANAIQMAVAPKGDQAFAAAVAAYGQILRDDMHLNHFSLADVRLLAGPQTDYRRQEFVEMTKLAEHAAPAP